jgi:hypothetical protein
MRPLRRDAALRRSILLPRQAPERPNYASPQRFPGGFSVPSAEKGASGTSRRWCMTLPSKPGARCTALAIFMPRMRTITFARTPRGREIVVSVALGQQPAEFVRLRGNQPLGREFALSE